MFLSPGIGQVLVDKRCGCLLQDMPDDMNRFVRSIEDMMYTSHQLMVFSNVHKKVNTKIWRKHVSSWDNIIETGKVLFSFTFTIIPLPVNAAPPGWLSGERV